MNTGQVVIVDPETDAIAALRQELTESGICVWHAPSGRELVHILRRHRVDVLVLNTRLPDMTGITAAGIARELQPGVKLIMTTAEHTLKLESQCRQLGLVYYGLRPLNYTDMRNMIQQTLGRLHLQRSGQPATHRRNTNTDTTMVR